MNQSQSYESIDSHGPSLPSVCDCLCESTVSHEILRTVDHPIRGLGLGLGPASPANRPSHHIDHVGT